MAESNKTEKATPKKRRDERKKGNAYQSKDVVSISTIIIGFLLVSKLGTFIAVQVKGLYGRQLTYMQDLHELTIASCMQIVREASLVFSICVIPLALALAFTGVIMTGVQTRFLVSGDLLKFKFSRISFIQGMKRLFSLRSVVQLVKSLIKIMVIMLLIYYSMKDLLSIVPDMLNTPMDETVSFLIDRSMSLVFRVCLIFVGVAILDLVYQRYDHEKKLRMSKQEIKEEYKQTEGDPFIKGKVKEKQRSMSMNRMIQQVPQADVVIRNPTHFAIALKYDIENDPAPMVLAKGQDHMAKRIIDMALRHDVLITENKPLARGLYPLVEAGSYIPGEFYQAVAEVMAWVYRNKDEDKKQG